MTERHFNLSSDPWIKVIKAETNQEQTVSLVDFFKHAQDYRQLAGEMRSQDFAVLRLLLAILTTVYTRFDVTGQPYLWFKNGVVDKEDDEANDDLMATWQALYQAGHFSDIVVDYLQKNATRFDFFGDRPFYQATTADYDALVPANKRVAKGKGQVAVKQLNRRISESGHTPSTFAPKTGEFKNEIDLDEFVRWIIMYQNYTGVTDKTKVENEEKFSNPAGWVYRLNPVYVQGKTLFETLMLNLVLVNQDQENPAIQRPVWEFESVLDYVSYRKRQALPDDLAGLYTAWSRILHIEWADNRHPIIFSAGIPMFSAEGARLEPMTTWRFDKKESLFRPAVKSLRSLSVAMWRNFGQYVKTNQDETTRQEPGLVGWLRKLKEDGLIPDNQILTLASVALVSDGNATSQSPAAEFADDLQLQANTLFDDSEMAERWPVRIEDTVTMTQKVGQDFYHFAADIGEIRNLVDAKSYASHLSAKFYASLNVPFKRWLAQLSGRDDRDEKINEWKQQLQELLRMAVQEIVRTSSSRDVIGIKDAKGRPMNIFTVRSRLSYQVRQDLDLKKE